MKKQENIKELLIIVDMVNGFVKEGALADTYITHIIEEIKRLVIDFQANQEKEVVFIRDAHNEAASEFNKFPVHCLDGTWESEIVDELKPYSLNSLVYKKNSRNAMFAPGFMSLIDNMKELRKVIITGCCTDLCDMDLAVSLVNYLDQMNRGVEVIVPKDAVETYDAPWHSRSEYTNMAFKIMEQEGVKLVKTLGGYYE